MNANAASRGAGPRVQAIILTKDRPQVLARCVATAISTLPPTGSLTVLDDSVGDALLDGAAVLSGVPRRPGVTVTHLGAKSLHEVVAKALKGSAPWQARTAARDIAPLRNLSLLISLAVGADTTILVDDDVCQFDLHATLEAIDALDCTGGVVAGAAIEGTTEQDTVTRLLDAMAALEDAEWTAAASIDELFRATSGDDDRGEHGYGLPSAGYTAFRLPSAQLFGFPPGYNEDWLWCLLHEAEGKTRVMRTAQAVAHQPPTLRRSSRDDILFEMRGDLVLDCLAEGRGLRPRTPALALEALPRHVPDPSVMPQARAAELLQRARQLTRNGNRRAVEELAGFGLDTLGEMQRSKELDMDGPGALREWCADALAKHRSFAAALSSAAVEAAVTASLRRGRR